MIEITEEKKGRRLKCDCDLGIVEIAIFPTGFIDYVITQTLLPDIFPGGLTQVLEIHRGSCIIHYYYTNNKIGNRLSSVAEKQTKCI